MNNDSDTSLFNAFLPHLNELRRRLIFALIALIFATIVSLIFVDPLMALLARPIGGISKLQSLEVSENLTASFNVSLLGGVVLAFPFIVYQLIAFILPGLKDNERRFLRMILPATLVFFVLGVLFAYFVLLPTAIPFLTGLTGIPTHLRTGSYFSFTTSLLFWVGVLFELPVAVFLLTKARLLSAALLIRHWRYAIVICAILAMVITPTVDPVNMMLLMIPLVGLFFISIGFARWAEKDRNISPPG